MRAKKKTAVKTSPLVESGSPSSKLLGMDMESLTEDFQRYLNNTLGPASSQYSYRALANTLRDRLIERWKKTQAAYESSGCKRAYYMSLEFLMGRALSNAMLNLGVTDETSKALYKAGQNLEELLETEPDAGLGNGGLGRLAACFLDSCATLQLPVTGYGLRYEYGMFRQGLTNGWQTEDPDHWLRDGSPWEVERREHTQRVQFGGRTEHYEGPQGQRQIRWVDSHDVLAVPFDTPIPGYRNGTVNTLRLWKAAATEEFDLEEFNAGSYPEAVAMKTAAEHITMVLYPNDASENGKELRLRQQYFLASASIKDVLRNWRDHHGEDFSNFAAKNCFQLNDTHPSISVAELMRQLMDEQAMGWDEAWAITSSTMAYTNHTLLPEALERWPVRLFRSLLPRLLEIIFEINARFLSVVAQKWPGDVDRLRRMSIIEESSDPQVRMAYLAIAGSFSINGVAGLHTRLLQEGLFKDFSDLWPEKFNNKTNGVTPRRWLANCNPELRELINETIGDEWVADLSQLKKLTPFADDAAFRERWYKIKQDNKVRLATLVKQDCRVDFNPEAIFDVQVKRIHEYKRQLLNILHVIHVYNQIRAGKAGTTKRCVLIGGKAAPGYVMAKLIIKLINNVANVVNNDPAIGELLTVAFVPNYRVSAMEIICPGTDLSEQVSTAGKEASGTGNMKFMMNGAITIGTLDGANIEIREEVGDDNFFLFGLDADEVKTARHGYNPNGIIEMDDGLAQVMKMLECGHFNQFEPGIFNDIIHCIRNPHDPWMTAADFRSYVDAQRSAADAYQDRETWVRMSILNTACSGRFSTDRTIEQYNSDIWKLDKTPAQP